ncbi:signal transduction histidine kinase [Kribbella orskensis]|uniref:histidine kinase n=1 Tax=Kribbella orskensis TaxID=2512216 RepID=A0ABY2BVW9_9ACTN|nr:MULTISPECIES: HAMP domain-containing sensor histidine kinase [Kribbella]TCN44073.1 signal transduction histidine kinase [Kribbella sp. VKM Ac-2500]TCO32149.1 signal transduction histidine kinase [Kribbella orskensis]
MKLPPWTQTIRFRLTVAYSAVLIGLSALVLGGLYFALSAYLDPTPLDPITVNKVYRDHEGNLKAKQGQTFQAAELSSIESAVNYKTLQTLRNYSAAGMGALFLVSLGTGWWLSGRALRPVRQITATAQDISATDLSRRIALQGPRDELRNLADTVDDMLGRLESAFIAQRQLVDDASHELRNPLAVIQANVDAVLAHDDTPPDDRAQATAIVSRAIQRMTRLVEDLLASARRSSPAFVDADVDLAAIAGEAAEEYALLAADRELHLVRRLAPGPIAAGDPQALRRAVDNLLSNAVRLARGGSELVLAVGSRNGWAWIAVRDEGPGIADEDADRVFDRFFRSGQRQPPAAVASTGQRRAGLGLAIVRQIVESHGGSVALHSELGIGSTFTLWLPERSLTNTTRRTPTPPTEDPLGPRH